MPDTIQQQAIVAFRDLVEAIPGGVTFYQDRSADVDDKFMPAINTIVDETGPSETIATGVVESELTIHVVAWVKAATAAAISGKLSELQGQVSKAIAADPTLGGLVLDTDETGCTRDLDNEKKRAQIGIHVQSFVITIWTKPGDPYTAAP